MTAFLTALRWDVVLQARNGFYWASVFVVVVIGGLLLAVPESVRSNHAALVPAIVAINLQITTFFFVAGLMLLDRDEGTLTALAVSPFSADGYLATRTVSLTALAAVETMALLWIAFDTSGSWLVLMGTASLGVIYTGFGAVVGARYASVNTLLPPAAVVVTFLLLPLIPHFGLGSRRFVMLHPIEPSLTLLRAGYSVTSAIELVFGVVGSIIWSGIAFAWGRNRVARLMRDTQATGGR
jgi:fluoroquinolone transport system permease protein